MPRGREQHEAFSQRIICPFRQNNNIRLPHDFIDDIPKPVEAEKVTTLVIVTLYKVRAVMAGGPPMRPQDAVDDHPDVDE